ncbi:glycosyltransferase family 2 protein [Aureibacter tunicatorum]|uniref:Glycosyltransferase involved in cell wall biosynthesis n=1 Tax=Aureibacter tunicatorum TaxID=866807 RepID=A0AAE3XMD2_9BACT|nr:glycosyltransferase family A protein [Aureibacter tunicatorum]MDR6240561.1 glycosyltransferase involved in cell wall biosynthesis [Aureibacter tunicatorum]BDD06578.1 glycosyl transferase family 2 [Aureibacter tunicatorum]
MHLISIVIPFYQPKAKFNTCIKSILNQTEKNFELILVNNNADQASRQIANKFAKEDSRIKIIEEKRQGVVYASNRGMAEAKGEFLVRMDADDIMDINRLKIQKEYLLTNKHCDVVSSKIKFEGNIEAEGFKQYVDWLNNITSYEDILLNQFIESPIVNPSVMIRRHVPESHGWYLDGDFPEDYELWLRWLSNGVIIEKTPQTLHHWVDSEERLTRTDDRYSIDSFFKIKSKYLANHLKSKNINSVCIWGAGRKSRQRLNMLTDHGITVKSFIDFKSKEINGIPCYNYNSADYAQLPFILSYVSNRGKRNEIRAFLKTKGKIEGKDFLCVG